MQVKDAHKKRRDVLVFAGVCLVLQLAVAPHICLGNGYANFAMVYTGVVALSIGGRSGVIAGFVSGLVFDLTATSPVGLMALLLTLCGYVLGIEERDRFGDGLVSSLTSFALGAMAVLVSYHLAMLLLGETSSMADVLVARTLPSFALTFLGFLPFAYLQVRASAKKHGIGGASSSHRGSHYDVSNL
ncbi:MAG: rod shape-determining protein MreD [Atopobiaceae bacterium]|nr:rod shape-determining protein MreD [Atopobiaceae bacterium]